MRAEADLHGGIFGEDDLAAARQEMRRHSDGFDYLPMLLNPGAMPESCFTSVPY